MIQKDNPKIVNAWAMYDWANSVYSLVITSTIFPIYYNSITNVNGSDDVVFLGMHFRNTALYSYALSFSFLLIAFLSPLLSGIADYIGNKKKFMQFFCVLGSVSCSMLYFFKDISMLWLGITAFIFASIGFAGSIVFYNAFLPEVASSEKQDKVSAKGFALGYAGSSILLIANLVMITFYKELGFSNAAEPSRISFLLTGLWWLGFALITFTIVPEIKSKQKFEFGFLFRGYEELQKVWKQLKALKALRTFLISFFFYNMGVQTVMYVAALFGDKEIKMESSQLIITILIIQFVAMAGAYLFSTLSKKFSNLIALSVAVSIWILICFCAYMTYKPGPFMALAALVGMVMGGVQSLSRSTYSKMLPETKDHASFFSFYDVCEKTGLVLGTASYGMIEEVTGSMRNSIFALALFFVAGLVFLTITRKRIALL